MHPGNSAQGYSGTMRIDLYTKAVLTIIAIMLAVIASTQLVSPRVANAQAPFAGVQWNGLSFFDSPAPAISGNTRTTEMARSLRPSSD